MKSLTAEQIFSIEDLKCCGNCKYYSGLCNKRPIPGKGINQRWNDSCDQWYSDLLTREERIGN